VHVNSAWTEERVSEEMMIIRINLEIICISEFLAIHRPTTHVHISTLVTSISCHLVSSSLIAWTAVCWKLLLLLISPTNMHGKMEVNQFYISQFFVRLYKKP
jgi:hypothetical protein